MNKNRLLKVLMLGFIMAVIIEFLPQNITAQTAIQEVTLQGHLSAPIPEDAYTNSGWADLNKIDSILVDNFEYWDSPKNHAWIPIEPIYCLGYGSIQNVLDFELESKVLNVYRHTSTFLLDPLTGLTSYKIAKDTGWIDFKDSDDPAPIWGDFFEFSCMIRHPLSFEDHGAFGIIINCRVLNTEDGQTYQVNILLRPKEFSNSQGTLEDSVKENSLHFDDLDKTYTVLVTLGALSQDGSWNSVSADLQKIIQKANAKATLIDFETIAHNQSSTIQPTDRTSINSVTIAGNQYRMDDIMFTHAAAYNSAPHLFRIGPIYGQKGNLSRVFWIMAEDTDFGMTMFENDEGDYEFTNIVGEVNGIETAATFNFSCEKGSLQNLGITDQDDMKTVVIKSDDQDDPDGIISTEEANLTFQFSIWGAFNPYDFLRIGTISCVPEGENDSAPEGTWPFSRDKTDGFPPYLLQKDGVVIPNLPDASDDDDDNEALYLRSMTNPMYVLAVALYSSGHKLFPNVRSLNLSFGQVPEDLIVTCRVSDGMVTDKETFPVSVVNYPVTNFPPMLDDLEDQIFYVNEAPDIEKGINVYQVRASDHDLQDMFNLTYHCTFRGWPPIVFQYISCPQRSPMNSKGLLILTPYQEGTLKCIISAEDPRGMYSVGEMTIFCRHRHRGAQFNQHPVILGTIDSLQTIKPGQLFIADEINFEDPDGDELYWSCNIGSVSENGLYTFQSQYPGYYSVYITAYDIRGGAATSEFVIHVLPWWAY